MLEVLLGENILVKKKDTVAQSYVHFNLEM